MENSNLYIVQNKTIIFNPEYNIPFSDRVLEILSNCNTIIFNENFSKNAFSKFNQPVDNLPNSIQTLTFGYCFNQTVDNLKNSIQNLALGFKFNQSVDNLPNPI